MKHPKLISYSQTSERIEFLGQEITHLEDFFPIEKLIGINIEFENEYLDCKKSKVDMNRINTLELYHANLKYHYNKI